MNLPSVRVLACIAGLLACTANAALTVEDPDGETGWGHVYISGGVVSYEFFRAQFGGKFDCDLDGHQVVDLGIGCDLLLEEDLHSVPQRKDVEGKIAIVKRGNCSFMDKAIVAQKAGALGVIIVNTAPGLMRAPAGVIRMKAGFDVTIPVVMIKTSDGEALAKITANTPSTLVRVVGESLIRGVTEIAGRCAAQAEVDAEGNVKGLPEPAKEIEGGVLQFFASPDDTTGTAFEFLTAMFGGPVDQRRNRYVFAEPKTGCDVLTNADAVKGNVAVVYRGDCLFANKAHNAEHAGAKGVLVANTEVGLSRMFGGDTKSNFVTIPVAMVSKDLAESMAAAKDGAVQLKPTPIKANAWDQAVRFAKQANWPEDDDARLELWKNLVEKHNPEVTEEGGPERLRLLQAAYDKANEYFAETSAVV
jgi:hypothetical protein